MTRLIAIFSALLTVLTVAPALSAKSAILVAHYGSSDDDTRAKTISLITEEVRQAFPAYEVREAYISPVVRRNLARRGVDTASPVDALLRLRADGYDSVYVQSTTLIDGSEMAEVRDAVARVAPFFSHISVGQSLMYSPSDCETVASILLREPCAKGEAVIYVGHGNMLPSTATYSQLDNMLGVSTQSTGTYHVSTIEGYPTAASTISQLRADRSIKHIRLIPLLLVCGNHTKNDIAGEYSDAIRAAGYTPEVVMRGLGENPAIRALYIDRIRQMLTPAK
ncbi:MAG: sirohydrochlorin cobaltochelatase [Bacteroides sp.]|nr:sirohydrochlorin cobaltochelatase [Bacteroides sp.]